jgi:hypothetical protein
MPCLDMPSHHMSLVLLCKLQAAACTQAASRALLWCAAP